MLLGFVILGLVPALVKLANTMGVSTAETVMVRFAIAIPLVFLWQRAARQRLTTGQPKLLLLRGVLGAIAVLLYFRSVQLVGAAVGTVLNYTYPLWANLFALFVGARPAWSLWPLLLAASAGVFLIIDPTLDGVGQGEAMGLGSALLAGGAVVCIKKLRATDSELSIILSFSVIGFMFAGLLAVFGPSTLLTQAAWSRPGTWVTLLGVGVLSFLGHLYFTRGYKHTSIELGTMLSLTVPVVATVVGRFWLKEPLTPKFLVGAGLIAMATVLVGLEHRSACQQYRQR